MITFGNDKFNGNVDSVPLLDTTQYNRWKIVCLTFNDLMMKTKPEESKYKQIALSSYLWVSLHVSHWKQNWPC